jgi:hypothetical protein
MFGLLANIFGSEKIVSKGLELIDEAWTSDEEKAENKAKIIEAKTEAKVRLLGAYAPFKLAQRYIAFTFTLIFAFIMLNGVLGALYGWVNIEDVNRAKEFANSMWLGEIMLAIVGFYFGGGLAESVNVGKKK